MTAELALAPGRTSAEWLAPCATSTLLLEAVFFLASGAEKLVHYPGIIGLVLEALGFVFAAASACASIAGVLLFRPLRVWYALRTGCALAVVLIYVGLVHPWSERLERQRASNTVTAIMKLKIDVEAFRREKGRLPANDGELSRFLTSPLPVSGWSEALRYTRDKTDPNVYVIRGWTPERNYYVYYSSRPECGVVFERF